MATLVRRQAASGTAVPDSPWHLAHHIGGDQDPIGRIPHHDRAGLRQRHHRGDRGGAGRELVPLVILGDDHDVEPAVPAVGVRDPVGVEDLHRLCLVAGAWHATPPWVADWMITCAGWSVWLPG